MHVRFCYAAFAGCQESVFGLTVIGSNLDPGRMLRMFSIKSAKNTILPSFPSLKLLRPSIYCLNMRTCTIFLYVRIFQLSAQIHLQVKTGWIEYF